MRELKCKNCGAVKLNRQGNSWYCEFCGSAFSVEASDVPQEGMGLSLNSDVEKLLQKCRTDPRNASKYANLILDMDPTNEDALKFL